MLPSEECVYYSMWYYWISVLFFLILFLKKFHELTTTAKFLHARPVKAFKFRDRIRFLSDFCIAAPSYAKIYVLLKGEHNSVLDYWENGVLSAYELETCSFSESGHTRGQIILDCRHQTLPNETRSLSTCLIAQLMINHWREAPPWGDNTSTSTSTRTDSDSERLGTRILVST